ncbi:flavin reductase family protein [Candidatus Leptofilum sp.]|uniref:flavin reductase family protein n=1 Tax=Candidatus Leptofilum sp. TaxID=3241576 RepID=UPI003B58D8EE
MTVTSEKYREALRQFPAGVTIVTIKTPNQEQPHGLTVSAFASISPEPPMIMIAIDHRASGYQMLEQEGTVFAVNILSQEMSELSNRFAWIKDEDRFAVGDWGTAVTGAPILKNALAWLDCTIQNRYEAGSNTIYIGKVEASGTPGVGEAPLIYWNRGYRYLKKSEESTD